MLVTGCSLLGESTEPLPDIKREQTFASSPPRQISDAGPAPGVMREAWRIEGLGHGEKVRRIRLAGGQLFLANPDGLDVYDARTGEKRWHYSEPGRQLTGYAVSKDDLVVASRTDDDIRLTGLAAGTGRLRWEYGADRAEWFTEQAELRLAMGEGVVPLLIRGERGRRGEEDQPDEFVALDSTTGEVRWRRPHHPPNDCDGAARRAATDTDGSVVVFAENCRDARYVYAFDPAGGKPLWSRTGASETWSVQLSVRGGATLIELGKNTRTVVGSDDREIANLNDIGQCVPSCSLRSVGEDLGLIHQDGSRAQVMSLIDVSTGQVRTLEARGNLAAVAGGRLYGFGSNLASGYEVMPLLPSRLDIVDVATDQLTTMPLPLNLGTGELVRWMAAGGDHLMVATVKQDELIAYASTPAQGPVELGGVAQDDWPQACDLVKDMPGRTPAVATPVKIGTQELARSRCQVSYAVGKQDSQARVEVLWVAASPAEADSLVSGEAGRYGADEVQRVTDNTLRVREGRFIVEVNAKSSDLERIVAGVVKSLS